MNLRLLIVIYEDVINTLLKKVLKYDPGEPPFMAISCIEKIAVPRCQKGDIGGAAEVLLGVSKKGSEKRIWIL